MTLKVILAAMLALIGVPKEDRAPELADKKARQQAAFVDAFARESMDAPRPPREWSALLATVLKHETHGGIRVQEGRCKPSECDHGRARGPFQQHLNKLTAPVWDRLVGVENTDVQVHAASDMLKRMYFRWKRHCAEANPNWVAGTLLGYSGRSCNARWDGLAPRLRSFAAFMVAQPES